MNGPRRLIGAPMLPVGIAATLQKGSTPALQLLVGRRTGAAHYVLLLSEVKLIFREGFRGSLAIPRRGF